MSRAVNIDEKIAAKGEINDEPVEITFRNQKWEFAPSLPAQLPEMFADGKLVSGLLLALNADQREDFQNLGITMDELGVFVEALAEAYGTSSEKSPASE